MFIIGYILSPLSWWNDAFVNLPLAYGFASLLSLVSRRLFLPAMVIGYWATNVIGLVLLSRGAEGLVKAGRAEARRRELVKTILFSVLYTVAVVVLIRLRVLKPAFHWR